MEVRARGYCFTHEGFSNVMSGDGLLGGLLKVGWHDVFYLKHVEGTNKITIKYYQLNNIRSVTKSVKSSTFNVKPEHVEEIKEIAKSSIPSVVFEQRPRKYTEACTLPMFLSIISIIASVFGAFVLNLLWLVIVGVAASIVFNIVGFILYDKNKLIDVYTTGEKPTFVRTRF